MDENIFEKIRRLVEQRNLFLAQHPELQPLQDELDEKLKGVTDINRRNQIVQEMMLNSWWRITKV